MSSRPFYFRHFVIHQDLAPMKTGTDSMILGAWADTGQASSILDIGTGTGILALMLAQKSKAHIDAVDTDIRACLQAEANFKNSSWKHRLTVYHTDIKDFTAPGYLYDLIICNPPYFAENKKAILESEKYSGRNMARSSAHLPFEILLQRVSELLDKQGVFYIILPAGEALEFEKTAEAFLLFSVKRLNIISREGTLPVRVIQGFRFEKVIPDSQKLIIYENDNTYTDDYISLTADFHAVDMMQRKKNKRSNGA